VKRLLGRPDHHLIHATRAGKATETGLLDDYAMMARAACVLFEATGAEPYLATARAWVATADGLFSADDGGWTMAAQSARDLIVLPRTAHDSATPAGAAVLVEALARLHWITGEETFRERAERAITAHGGEAAQAFPSGAALLNAAELLYSGVHVVLLGDADDPALHALRRAALHMPEPRLVMANPKAGQTALNGQATAYVCHGPVCLAPVSDPAALRAALKNR